MKLRNTLLLLVAAATLASAADPAVELEAAIRRETVQGDLKGAAEAYRKIAANSRAGRDVAARALLRLAMVYRKQGDAQAKQTLDRLVREFADQPRTVAEARAELARLAPAAGRATLAVRRVWKGRDLDISSRSVDGTMASFVDTRTANVGVMNLVTGETRMLTNYGNWNRMNGVAGMNQISPDGKWVVFYAGLHLGAGELRLIRTDGSETKVLQRGVVDNRTWPVGWTADSRNVIGHHIFKKANGTWQEDLDFVPVDGGPARAWKAGLGTVRSRLRVQPSPDGKWLAYSSEAIPARVAAADDSGRTGFVSTDESELVMGWAPDGRSLLTTSTRSGAPAIWKQPLRDGQASGAPELVRSFSARPWGLGVDAKGTVYYGEGTSATDVYTVGLDAARGTFAGAPRRVTTRYEGNTSSPMWSADGKRLAWFTLDRGRLRELVVRDLASGKESNVVVATAAQDRPSPEWLPDGQMIISKPVGMGTPPRGDDVNLYRMDPATGGVTPIRQPGYYWSRDGAKIYEAVGPVVTEIDAATGAKREIYRDTLAAYLRDVVPSPDGRSLAVVAHQNESPGKPDFYGPVHIKIVDLATGQGREIVPVRPSWLRRMMAWTPDSRSLIYATEQYAGMDQPTRLWIVPAAGGTPRQLGRDFDGRVFGMAVSPDGKTLAFDESRSTSELMAMEGLFAR